ncbi:MAG TPA: hypothetical protein VLA34_05850, partial [Candidatus Krumholzibacterium sp.]|nr:hypothetical protein [Candidatus Krumholzibacterium sp.]
TVPSLAALQVVAGSWATIDDGDGDNYTPYIGDSAPTNWEAKGVLAGDKFYGNNLVFSPPTGLIQKVDQLVPGNKLILDRELVHPSGAGTYTISRDFGAVYLDQDMTLYVANGPNAIAKIATLDWFWADEATTPQALFVPDPSFSLVWRGDVSKTAATSFKANGLARRGNVTYLATDIGVHAISDDDLEQGRIARFTYSTEAVTEFEADFRILEGTDKNIAAIAVDPETGNISVAVTDFESVVTEINPNIEQAFRFFDQVGRIRSLVTYRNPKGPPDAEVS